MSYDLKNKSGECFSLNNSRWRYLFDLAKKYGYKPKGVINPDIGEKFFYNPDTIYDEYFLNDGLFVSDRDANEIASALKKALDDIPRPTDPVENITDQHVMEVMQNIRDMELPLKYDDEGEVDEKWSKEYVDAYDIENYEEMGRLAREAFTCDKMDNGYQNSLNMKRFIEFCESGGFSIY
jgi:hypothetical protein